MTDIYITEREIFERYGESVGWDMSRNENGEYSKTINDTWKGWLLRADMQKAKEANDSIRNLKSLENLFKEEGLHEQRNPLKTL